MTTLPRLLVGGCCCCCPSAPALFLRTSRNIPPLRRTQNIAGISCASELRDTGVPGGRSEFRKLDAVGAGLFISHAWQRWDVDMVPEHVEAEAARNERGVQFLVGSSFYREESAVGRDLACLAAAVYKEQKGRLHVLDALCGSGVRAARYLAHSGADFVWANDACDHLDALIAHNLSLASPSTASETETDVAQQLDSNFPPNVRDESGRWQVTTQDANKVLLDCYMRKNYFDLIDVDSFGSDSVFLGSALSAVSYGGLIYATSTDGLSSGGHRPHNALASYGAYIRPVSFSNEIGLRMLIGGVVREAALRNMHVHPVFSHYSPHGPVFRVMLRVLPSKAFQSKDYNFIAYCRRCGETQVTKWSALGCVKCSCASSPPPSTQRISSSITVNGPLWTGPLHNTDDVKRMTEMAKSWGWIEGNRESTKDRNLKKLLDVMLEESNPDLQVGYIDLDEISTRTKADTPRRDLLLAALRQEGYAASRSHIKPNAIKTNCSLARCVEIVLEMTQRTSAV